MSSSCSPSFVVDDPCLPGSLGPDTRSLSLARGIRLTDQMLRCGDRWVGEADHTDPDRKVEDLANGSLERATVVMSAAQVAITPMIHAVAANRTDASSRSIETPTARRAACVEGQAKRGPTRWSSDA
jgi:hypothetical protein